jgi:hypothetical protein
MKPVFTCTDHDLDPFFIARNDGSACCDIEMGACDLCGFALTPENVSWEDGNYCDHCDRKMHEIAAYDAVS